MQCRDSRDFLFKVKDQRAGSLTLFLISLMRLCFAHRNERAVVEEEIRKVDEKLREIKAYEKDMDRETKQQRLLVEMKEVIKGGLTESET